MTDKKDTKANMEFAEDMRPFGDRDFARPQTGFFIPTEADAEAALAGMRPEVRRAYEKSLKQFGGLYKKLADM